MATRRVPDEAVVTAIVTALKASTGLTALVGTRIYNNVPQSETYPYVVVTAPTVRRADTLGRFGGMTLVDLKAISQERGDQEGMRILDQCVRAVNFTEPAMSGHTALGIVWDQTERYQEVVNGIPTRHHVASCRAWTEQSTT